MAAGGLEHMTDASAAAAPQVHQGFPGIDTGHQGGGGLGAHRAGSGIKVGEGRLIPEGQGEAELIAHRKLVGCRQTTDRACPGAPGCSGRLKCSDRARASRRTFSDPSTSRNREIRSPTTWAMVTDRTILKPCRVSSIPV